MIFEMTEKQYQLFLHIMQVMQTFYGNDFSSICKEVKLYRYSRAVRVWQQNRHAVWLEYLKCPQTFSAHASAAPETRPAIVAVHQPERRRYRKRSCRQRVSRKRSCEEIGEGESVAAS